VQSFIEERKKFVEKFVSILSEAAVVRNDNNKVKFDKVIGLITQKRYEEMARIASPESASALYNYFATFTTRTLSQLNAEGITVDGELAGAVSTSCSFRIVAQHGNPSFVKVFKFATDPNDEKATEDVARDAKACVLLREKNHGTLPDGIVNYEAYVLTTADKRVIVGTLSKIYPLTLDKFNGHIAPALLLQWLTRLYDIIKSVHKLQLVFCDIKPGNLFLSNKNELFVGDLETLTAAGNNFTKYTAEFIPNKFINDQVACYEIDWYCFLTTALELVQRRPRVVSISSISKAIGNLEISIVGEEIPRLLNEILKSMLQTPPIAEHPLTEEK